MNTSLLTLFCNHGAWAMTGAGVMDWIARLAGFDGRAPLRAGDNVNWLGDSFPTPATIGNVAIVPVSGPLILRPSYIEKNLGAMGYDQIGDWLDGAVASGVKGIVLAVNSPGGSVNGMFELAEKIDGIAQQMPICAVTDGTMGSAAYAISSPAGQILTTRSAIVGSIGCVAEILDASAFLESMGLKFNQFASGKFKGAGSPTQPLSGDQAAMFSGMVSRVADEFKDLATSYRKIPSSLMEGQAISGAEAVRAGLADGLVSNVNAAVESILTGTVSKRTVQGRWINRGPQKYWVDDDDGEMSDPDDSSKPAPKKRPPSGPAPSPSTDRESRLRGEWEAATPAQRAEFNNSFSAFAAYRRRSNGNDVRRGGGGSRAYSIADIRRKQ